MTYESSFAIGSPNFEMFMRSFDLWVSNNEDSNVLKGKYVNGKGYSFDNRVLNTQTFNGKVYPFVRRRMVFKFYGGLV